MSKRKRDKKAKTRKEKAEFYRAKIEQLKNPRTHIERTMLRMFKDMLKKYEST